jgi:hypothetical protein
MGKDTLGGVWPDILYGVMDIKYCNGRRLPCVPEILILTTSTQLAQFVQLGTTYRSDQLRLYL